MSNEIENKWLNDTWSIYFHNPFDNNWDESGYIKLFTLANIEEFIVMNSLLKKHTNEGMFFIMRDHIFPKWNDPENKNGGFLSIKILKDKVPSFFEKIVIDLINETLLKPEYYHLSGNINGVSISPKKHFCIIKVWVKNFDLNDSNYFNITKDYHGTILFKTNTCVA
jgi:hypothetical protein